MLGASVLLAATALLPTTEPLRYVALGAFLFGLFVLLGDRTGKRLSFRAERRPQPQPEGDEVRPSGTKREVTYCSPQKPHRQPTTGGLVAVSESSRPGSNDPCWCGSGKKYKKCHGSDIVRVRVTADSHAFSRSG